MGARLLTTTTQLPLLLFDKHGEPFLVRQMVPEDRAALHAMYLDFHPKRVAQGLPPETDYAQKRWLDHVLKGGEHLLVEVNDEVRGHLMLHSVTARIDNVFDTEYRNHLSRIKDLMAQPGRNFALLYRVTI